MNKKNAFTLAELLIVFTMIGVLTVVALNTMKGYDRTIRYSHASVYHNLDRAFFNAMFYSDNKNPFTKTDYNPDGSSYEVSAQEGAKRLCDMLASYLNVASNTCSSNGLANLNAPDGAALGTVQLTTLNGVELYISERQDKQYPFFIIYADINGPKPPNTLDYQAPSAANGHRTKDPDRFAFAALSIGRICPLGVPEVDPKFMTARIAYVSITGERSNKKKNADDDNEETPSTKFSTNSKSYVQTKAEAWGYYITDNFTKDKVPIEDEPTSYNDFIRSELPQGTKIYKSALGNNTKNVRLTAPNGTTLQNGAVKDGGYGCSAKSAEECWVIVDKYAW